MADLHDSVWTPCGCRSARWSGARGSRIREAVRVTPGHALRCPRRACSNRAARGLQLQRDASHSYYLFTAVSPCRRAPSESCSGPRCSPPSTPGSPRSPAWGLLPQADPRPTESVGVTPRAAAEDGRVPVVPDDGGRPRWIVGSLPGRESLSMATPRKEDAGELECSPAYREAYLRPGGRQTLIDLLHQRDQQIHVSATWPRALRPVDGLPDEAGRGVRPGSPRAFERTILRGADPTSATRACSSAARTALSDDVNVSSRSFRISPSASSGGDHSNGDRLDSAPPSSSVTERASGYSGPPSAYRWECDLPVAPSKASKRVTRPGSHRCRQPSSPARGLVICP